MALSRIRSIIGLAALIAAALGLLLLLTPSAVHDGPHPEAPASTPALPAGLPEAKQPTRTPAVADVGPRTRIRVMDLATGDAVAGVRLAAPSPASDPADVFLSDPDGYVDVPTQSAEDVKPLGEWVRPRNSGRDVRETARLWIHRMLSLEVFVAPDPRSGRTLDYSLVNVRVLALGPPGVGLGRPSPDPWNLAWYRRHALLEVASPTRVDANGRATFDTPMLKYLGVRADAPGWASAEVDVPTSGSPPVRVSLTMRPLPRVNALVRSHDGKPIEKAQVNTYILRRDSFPGTNPDRLKIPGAGHTVIGRPDGTVLIQYGLTLETDEEGEAPQDVPVDGEVALVVHAPGFLPWRRILGDLTGDAEVEVVLEVPAEPLEPVTFLWQGEPLANTSLVIGDITDLDRQTSTSVRLDKHGMWKAEWLVEGRTYGLVAFGGRNAVTRWKREATVDLAELPRTLKEFQAQDSR